MLMVCSLRTAGTTTHDIVSVPRSIRTATNELKSSIFYLAHLTDKGGLQRWSFRPPEILLKSTVLFGTKPQLGEEA